MRSEGKERFTPEKRFTIVLLAILAELEYLIVIIM
jgi:hypothetical protein